MYDNDYIILFDENGQPYIEHASLAGIKNTITGAVSSAGSKLKGMKRPGAKYYARLDDPKRPGKYLYFYSKEEYDRYRENQTRSRTADRELKRLERAVQANPSAKNIAALRSKREEINNAKRQAEESENAARKRADDITVGASLNRAKQSAGNNIKRMKNDLRDKVEDARDAIQRTTGIGLKSKAEKERKEANKANTDYNTMLEGYRNAFNTGDKAAEEHLGKRVREYGDTRDREEREAREAEDAYNNSWAGKVSNMINKARGAISSGKDKASDIIKSIKDNSMNLKNMSVAQINKMADDLKSAPARAREYIDAGRDAIQNTTGIGLRETGNILRQRYTDASFVRDKILAEHSAALEAGDTERAAGLRRAFDSIDETVREYEKQIQETTTNYSNSIAGKINNARADRREARAEANVSESQLRNIMEKYNNKESLTNKEMEIVMKVLGGIFNS